METDTSQGPVNNVFVYGTLKVGYAFGRVFANQRVSASVAAIRHARLYDLGSYPAMIINPAFAFNDVVEGEIHSYRDLDAVVERMDDIEGFDSKDFDTVIMANSNNLFNRVKADASYLQPRKGVRCMAYTWGGDPESMTSPRIPCVSGSDGASAVWPADSGITALLV